MTRKKVKLVPIPNDRARKACLKKRRVGLLKKVDELTTLCGVDGFMIIYSPDETEPMTVPSRREVEEKLEKYQSIPEMERSKKATTQDSYLEQRIEKTDDDLTKYSKKNRATEMSYLMHKLRFCGNDINCLDLDEKKRLILLLGERMQDMRKRSDYLGQVPPLDPSHSILPPRQPLPHPQPPLPPIFEERVGDFRANPTDSVMLDQWFLKMMQSSDNVAGGSGSSAPPPQGFNFSGFGGTGDGAGALGLGRNPFETVMDPPNQNPFGISFCRGDFGGVSSNANPPPPPQGFHFSQGDFGGVSSNANPQGIEPNPHTTGVSGFNEFDEGLSRYFPSESDVPKLPWSSNFSP